MKELFINLVIVIAISLIVILIVKSPYIIYRLINNDKDKVEVCDTLYNKVTLDSIEYNIIKRDTIIYNIKTEMKYEIEESKLLSDSNAVELFIKLVAE